MSRREFSKRVKAEIIHRAMNEDGKVVCEGCGLVLGSKRYDIDHTIPDALTVDKTKPLTKDDGKLLGLKCCHRPKTASDVGAIARAVRREAKHLGIKRASSWRKPPPGFRFDWKAGRYVKEAT